MFKIAKLEDVNNEVVKINYTLHEHCKYENNKKYHEEFKTLMFDISGDNYSFTFELNCKLEKLLEIPMTGIIDFNEYILQGETWLNIKGKNGIEPEIVDAKITRYLNNKFIINIAFYAEYAYNKESYSGTIEFIFNLDDYLNK